MVILTSYCLIIALADVIKDSILSTCFELLLYNQEKKMRVPRRFRHHSYCLSRLSQIPLRS